MTNTLSAQIQANIEWLLQDAQAISTLSDGARLEFSQPLVDGTGAGEAQKVWHAERTVAAGANDDLVLSNLPMTVFGSSAPRALATLRALLLVNLATTAGDNLLVGGAASNAFSAPFNGSGTAKVSVPAGAPLLIAHPLVGWTVTSGSTDVLRIANAGAGSVTYRIVLLGT